MPLPNACATFTFTTESVPRERRAEAVREIHLHERAILSTGLEPLEPLEPLAERQPHVELTKRTLPGLAVVSGILAGLRNAIRPRGAVLNGGDDILIAVGCGLARHRKGDLSLQPGDALLATREATGMTIARPKPTRFIGVRVPRAAVSPLVGRIDGTLIRLVPAGTETLKLLVTYARAITDALPLASPELQRLAVTHMHDLMAATIGTTRDSQAIVEGRGIAAARLRSIMADISANLGDDSLSVVEVARRQRVTPRYVHRLFENEGLTFSSFVLGQRLSRAHRILNDPQHGDRNISSVAFDVGFGDLSYFNRTFRRRFAATPREIRQAAIDQTRC